MNWENTVDNKDTKIFLYTVNKRPRIAISCHKVATYDWEIMINRRADLHIYFMYHGQWNEEKVLLLVDKFIREKNSAKYVIFHRIFDMGH